MKAITQDSQGICVYQEQYLQIAKTMAGFTGAEAETLRRAIGKKIHELMASLKPKFLDGCAANNVTPSVANQLWKDMESSQDYSFNKAHSVVFNTLPGLAAKRGLPLVATGDVHYLDADRRLPARGAPLHPVGRLAQEPEPLEVRDERVLLQVAGGDGARLPRARGRDAAHARDRRPLQRRDRARPDPAAEVPDARRAATPSTTSSSSARTASRSATTSVTPELDERLQFELKTMREMGFADYFLIVADFIALREARRCLRRARPRQRRGLARRVRLGITDIDPMRYGLLFERFLNPARKDMPDMDIDFAVEGRERVINYVAEKYGRDRVAQIITFSTMAARAAVRDAGRVLEIPYGTVDRIAKMIPEGPGQTLEEALKPGAELANAVKDDPVAKEIIDLARPLEGLTRADSIHAAGVVIGAQPLIEVVPLQQKGADQEVVTQFSMKNVEALGLLKMDFLGLRNLDVIDKAVELIGDGLDIAKIPIDDRRSTRCSRAPSRPASSSSSRRACATRCAQVKPTEFEDLIALVALYRPGPMQYIPSYAARKNGREAVTYIDERLKRDHERLARNLHLPGAVHADRQADGRLHARRGRDAAARDRQEDPRADGVAEGEVPRRLRRQQRHARRSRTSSGRTWSRRRTTPSTRRTRPATR